MRRLLTLLLTLCPAPLAAGPAVSGYAYMEPATQQLQDDDFLNPAFFYVERGQQLWEQPWPGAAQSCQSCHGAPDSLAGVAARYPRYEDGADRVLSLEDQIRAEIARHFAVTPPPPGDDSLIALTMLVGLQSRGMPLVPEAAAGAAAWAERGRSLFNTRMGQLNLACAHCHEDRAGQKLRGDTISQGQINAFPIFRLIWDDVGTLDRMISWCMEAVRAEPFGAGSEEYRALELYLAQRGAGLTVETPGVRR